MIVSRVVVSLRIPGLEKKSLVKIASPVYNCRMVEVHTMNKLVRVLRNFGIEGRSCSVETSLEFINVILNVK